MILRTDDPKEIKRVIEINPAVIVEFSTEWCGPCKKLAEDLKIVDKKFGNSLTIIQVDKDIVSCRKTLDNQVSEQEFLEILPFYEDVARLGGVPVIIFFKDGMRIDKILDQGERMNGMIFGAIPGVKLPRNQFISIEEIITRERMISAIRK